MVTLPLQTTHQSPMLLCFRVCQCLAALSAPCSHIEAAMQQATGHVHVVLYAGHVRLKEVGRYLLQLVCAALTVEPWGQLKQLRFAVSG